MQASNTPLMRRRGRSTSPISGRHSPVRNSDVDEPQLVSTADEIPPSYPVDVNSSSALDKPTCDVEPLVEVSIQPPTPVHEPVPLLANENVTSEQLQSRQNEANDGVVQTPRVAVRNRLMSSCSHRSEDDDIPLLDDLSDSHIGNHHNIQKPIFVSPHMEDKLRRKLKFFFMNPYQKWQARRKFPLKLVLQIIKLVLVTAQLIMFGQRRFSHVDFIETTGYTLHHLYLKTWDASDETPPYPPAKGTFAIYTHEEFYSFVDYALNRYNHTDIAIGTYSSTARKIEDAPMKLCKTRYKKGKMFPFNSTYIYDASTIEDCIDMEPVTDYNSTTGENMTYYDSKRFLKESNHSIQFDRLITAELRFTLRTIHLKGLSHVSQPDCFEFNVAITFDNTPHDGQVKVNLEFDTNQLECNGTIRYSNSREVLVVLNTSYDVLVILVSFVSLLLCTRSLFRGSKLRRETCDFFKKRYNKELTAQDKFEFLDMWYILIVLNDLMTIIGSILKVQIESRSSYNYEMCGLLLGTGSLLVWFGVLRYLGFFPKYNVLILTMKASAPSALRFIGCAGVIYLGFTFCGWVVLGPYHLKFRQLSTASENLFALLNGDEIFVTFSMISNKRSYVWWYSRVFLYSFISLFIYIVLSVFISVIMDSYETIKYYYENGFPESDMHKFMAECKDHPTSHLYRSDEFLKDGSCSPLSGCFRSCRNCCSGCCVTSYEPISASSDSLTETS